MRKTKQRTTAELAKKYQCNARTIRNWRAEGAPLDNPKAMKAWLAGRKNVPPSIAAGEPDATPIEADATPRAKGAAAALARLEAMEVSAYDRLEAALKSNDPMRVKVARGTWLDLCEQLRHFERAVAEDKRKSGALVNRDEIERALWLFGRCLRCAAESIIEQTTPSLAGTNDNTELVRVRAILRRLNYGALAISAAAVMPSAPPPWIVEAMTRDLLDATTYTQADLDGLAEAVKSFIEHLAPRVIETAGTEL